MNYANKGRRRTQETCTKISAVQLGRKHSAATCYKRSLALRGSAAPNWKGGINAGNRNFRSHLEQSLEYRQWHRSILCRDNFACQMCSTKSKDLHVHHIKPLQTIIDEHSIATVDQARICQKLWDAANGQTLCSARHRAIHHKVKDT